MLHETPWTDGLFDNLTGVYFIYVGILWIDFNKLKVMNLLATI